MRWWWCGGDGVGGHSCTARGGQGAAACGNTQMLALFISLQDKQEDLTSGQTAARAGPRPARHVPRRRAAHCAGRGRGSLALTYIIGIAVLPRPCTKGEFRYKSRLRWPLLPTPARTFRKVEAALVGLAVVASTGGGRCPAAACVVCCPATGGGKGGERDARVAVEGTEPRRGNNIPR